MLGWVQDWAAHAELVAMLAGQLVPTPRRAVLGRGGVGFTAAQLARRPGARVVGIAGPASADRLRAHGIVPVSYGDGVTGRFGAASGDGFDAFIDAAGSGSIDMAFRWA